MGGEGMEKRTERREQRTDKKEEWGFVSKEQKRNNSFFD